MNKEKDFLAETEGVGTRRFPALCKVGSGLFKNRNGGKP